MADQAGTILRGYGHCPEYLEFFSSKFDSGRLISGRTRTEADQVRPRWFGQDVSEVPDSGIGDWQSTDVSLRGPPGVRGRSVSVRHKIRDTGYRRVFADVNASMRLQLVRDRLIAGQAECSLRRHLDSVGPDAPIRDIVDSCRMWESHAEGTDSWGGCHEPERPQALYQVVDDSKPKVASEDSDVMGQIMRHLLPMPPVSPPKTTPIPLDHELLIQRLIGTVHPVVQERSSLMDIEILLQSMLPVRSVAEENVQPPAVHQEPTAGCFSCGELGHATARCPVLDESFPFLPPGWRADRTDDEFVLRPAQGRLTVSKRETSTDPGRGVGRPDQ